MTRLLLALCAVAALSGCTVPVVGSTGIGVDQEGRPVGYLAVCDEHIDGATLYYEDPSATSAQDRSVDAGSWIVHTPITSFSTWSLIDPQEGWTATLPLAELRADREYSLFGGTRDNTGSTGAVTFTEAQLRGLAPGQVAYLSGYDAKADQDVYTTGSVDEFRAFACRS